MQLGRRWEAERPETLRETSGSGRRTRGGMSPPPVQFPGIGADTHQGPPRAARLSHRDLPVLVRSPVPPRTLALLAILAIVLASPLFAQRVTPDSAAHPADSASARASALELHYAIAERQRAFEAVRHAEAEQALETQLADWKRNSLLAFALLVVVAGWLVKRQHRSVDAIADQLETTDSLTGLRNRRYVQQIMPAEVSGFSRRHRVAPPGQSPTDSDLVFFVVDIDHFRRINDAHGHAAGDRVLEQVARQLTATLRDSDVVARWGGEEFLVVSRFTNRDRAGELAERIRSKVEGMQTALPDGSLVSVTCSIGFAAFPFSRSAPESVGWEGAVAIADLACYAAKRDGRNGWACFRASQQDGIDVTLQDVTIADIEARVADGSIVLEGARDLAGERTP